MFSDRNLGILVVHNDPVPEREISRAIGPHNAVITARFALNRHDGEEYGGESVDAFLTPQVRASIGWLVDAGADAVALCFTSISMLGPGGFDDDFAVAVEEAHGVPAFTAGAALRRQVEAAAPQAPLLIIPPWFTDATVAHAVDYLRTATTGAKVAVHRFELPAHWDTTSRQDLFDRGAKTRISPHHLIQQVEDNAPAETDLVVVPGSGFATLGSLDGAVAALPPMLSANSAVASYFMSEDIARQTRPSTSDGSRYVEVRRLELGVQVRAGESTR